MALAAPLASSSGGHTAVPMIEVMTARLLISAGGFTVLTRRPLVAEGVS